MSSPANSKFALGNGPNGKKYIACTPPKNLHLVPTQMMAFLNTVRSTSYGPILDELNVYFKKRVTEDDDYIRTTKNQLQVIVRDHRDIDEGEVNKWVDNVQMGLNISR
jgi:hypothetical protein